MTLQKSFLPILTDVREAKFTEMQAYATTVPEMSMSATYKTWLCSLEQDMLERQLEVIQFSPLLRRQANMDQV